MRRSKILVDRDVKKTAAGHHRPRRRVFVARGATNAARAIRTRHGRIVDCVLGVLAPAAKWRTAVVPEPAAHTETPEPSGDERDSEPTDRPRRSRWRPWAELLKRSFDIDLLCPRCHSPMKLKSSLTTGKSLQRLLSRLGEQTDIQGKAPARGPPYFASQVLRRRFGEHSTQLDMLA